jgi:Zn-finger nucleic acid-binding protein
MELICPKCRGAMRQYERSGVTIDQCTECRGIFLDRGELERLIDAEAAFAARSAAPMPAGRPYEQRRHDDHDHHDDHGRHEEHGHYDDHGYQGRKKRGSFFEQLFD